MTAVLDIQGVQEPRLRECPHRDSEETGHAAVAFYEAMTGRQVLQWQENAVVDIYAERELTDGRWRWASTDTGLIVARQNGKGDVLMIVALYSMFVLKIRRTFWTAQLQKTATDAHKRMADVIKASPKLLAQLRGGERGIRSGKGDERIVMADGREILFFTRSDNAGRGLYGDLLILDEAYDLTDGELRALRPLLKTSPNPMVIYTSTPVDGDTMPNGIVLSRVRKNALVAKKPRMQWIEYSVPSLAELTEAAEAQGRQLLRDPRPTDPNMWALANPSLNQWIDSEDRVLLDPETLEDDLPSMGVRGFLVEDLCAPDFWPDPDLVETGDVPFDAEAFRLAARPGTVLLDPVALGVDRSPGGQTSVVAAGWTSDGRWASDTIACRPGSDWVIDLVLCLVEDFEPAILVLDGASPAAALLSKFQANGIEPFVTGPGEMAQACQGMVDDFKEGRWTWSGDDPALASAVDIARWRSIGTAGQKAFDRKGQGDISSLVAAALAGFGLRRAVVEAQDKPADLEPEPLVVPYSAGEERVNPLSLRF